MQGYGIRRTDGLKAAIYIGAVVLDSLIWGATLLGLGLILIDLFIKMECHPAIRLIWVAIAIYILLPVVPEMLLTGALCEIIVALAYAYAKTGDGG